MVNTYVQAEIDRELELLRMEVRELRKFTDADLTGNPSRSILFQASSIAESIVRRCAAINALRVVATSVKTTQE